MDMLTKPEHLISLASSAVLVSVDISVWSATKQDRSIRDEVTSAKNADKSAGRYVKNLLANHPKHKAVVNYRQTIYNWLQRRTYRWNQSQNLLPSVDVPKFKQEYHEHELAFHSLVDDLINQYDDIVSDMAFKQGDMFDRNDYPHKDQVKAKFSLQLYVSEVPMNDFRCGIAQDIADDLFTTLNKQAGRIIESVHQEQSERMIEVMQSIIHCCGHDETEVNGEVRTKKRKIYDTTIQKALEMCETFKRFNLKNSPELEQARASLERILNDVKAEDLRDSDAVRHHVKEGIDDILSKFGSFNSMQ
jgi:uncharacterized membrane-anchored protein YjiN (DUF445 family)